MPKKFKPAKKIAITLTAFLIISTLYGCGNQSTTSTETAEMSPETQQALENAYLYTLPLAMVNATMEKSTNAVEANEKSAPPNQLFHLKHIATSASHFVVTPNVDTVYSQAFLNFAEEEALVLEKPKSDRYYSIQILNGYTDTVALLGSSNDEQEKKAYLITKDDYNGKVPSDMKHIKLNTDMAWGINRIICDDENDLKNVYKLQEKTQLIPLKDYNNGEKYEPKPGSYDEKYNFVPVDHVMEMTAKEYFDVVNKLMVSNPPQKSDEPMIKILADVNVGGGMTFDESILGSDPENVWKTIKNSANKKAAKDTIKFSTTNGPWSYYDKPIGEFGTEYGYRGMIALRGLGANPVEAAIYAKADNDSDGNALNGKNEYKIHFEPKALPPVKKHGFWSVTAYGEDDFLIDNSEDKYAITDRTPISKNPDGSIDLYVSKELPKGVNKENWLPVKDKVFHLFLRIYLPTTEVSDGTWTAPTLKLNVNN